MFDSSLPNLLRASALVSTALLAAGCSGGSSSADKSVTLSGVIVTVQDPYATGCMVTDENGTAGLEVDPVNSPGRYSFPPTARPVGTITASGCTDAATGLALDDMTMPGLEDGDATSDQLMITTITTMVTVMLQQQATIQAQAGLLVGVSADALAAAYAKVKAAFGIPAEVDLASYDPIAAANAGDSSALAIGAAATKLANAVAAIKQSAPAATADEIVALMATQLDAAPLDNPLSVPSFINAVALAAGADAAAADQAALAVANVNMGVDTFVSFASGSANVPQLMQAITASAMVMASTDLATLAAATDASVINGLILNETVNLVMAGLTSTVVAAEILKLTGSTTGGY